MSAKPKRIIIALIYLLAAAYTAAFAVSVYSDFRSIILIAAGGGACYMFSSALHEAGHILASKIFGFKVVGYSVGLINVDKTLGKKIRIKRSEYAGETDVVPIADKNFSKRYFFVIFGGLAGGFVACVLVAVLFAVFTFNRLIAALFISFPLLIAMFIINLVPGIVPSSDGSYLAAIGKEENRKQIENYFGVLYGLYQGKTFSEIDEELFSPEDVGGVLYEELITVRLMRAEEEDNAESMRECLKLLDGLENRLIDTDKELLCAATILGDEGAIERFKWVKSQCDAYDDLRSMRVLISCAKADGDENYVAVAKASALRAAEKWYLKGEGRFTANMLKRL